tara:strand:+ start:506 stop:751 length:246 start_codon:yes stop_codon:yes gene_type:complete
MVLLDIIKRKRERMRLKDATTILMKETEFLGMTFEEVLIFCEKNPYIVKNSTFDAFAVWKKEMWNESWSASKAMEILEGAT